MSNMASVVIQNITKTLPKILEQINRPERDSQNKQKHATFTLMKIITAAVHE